MKQKPIKSAAKVIEKKPLNSKPKEPRLNLIYCLVLLGYAFITVLTPNMNTLDSNGPKFYTLSMLNLIAYIIILIGNQLKRQQVFHSSYFRTWIGFIYTLFLLVSLLSFFKAFNIYESIINISKLFTIFSAAYIISIILRNDKRYFYLISISLAFLLIFDSFTVFYHLLTNFIEGKEQNIKEIKSIYSNKNILSAAIFVKIPFARWLFSFSKGWMKALGSFTLFVALVATLFMSTRTFYIGAIFLIISFGPFMFIRYYRKKEKRKILRMTVFLSAAIILVFFLFSLGIKYLYPKSDQREYTVDFISRLKSISPNQAAGGGQRVETWKRSFKLIKENPILGVGTGNWKVEVLKDETPTTGAYIFMYKNHNDFIETAADTGIFAGVLFLGIFILIFANFIKAFFKAKKEDEESYKWLFLPAFGLFCYFFDAFFNFPSDRPEIFSFFAIFVGAGVAFSSQSAHITRFSSFVTRHLSFVSRSALRVTLIMVFLSLMVGSIYIFYLNFVSLKLQRIAKEELNAGVLRSPSDLFMNGFPALPDINIEGEPIAVTKARYLITEEKYQQAIDLLKKDNSSPYDTRQEFFIAMAYLKMNQFDSSLMYTQKVYKLKPYFSGNVSLMSSSYEAKGDLTMALKVLDDHIQLNKKNKEPVTDIIYKQQADLTNRTRIQQFKPVFDKAIASFNAKDYNNALRYFSEFIDKEQGVSQAFEYRAFCYFYLNKFQLSNTDIERAIALDPSKPGYLNLHGVNLQMLGNTQAACVDFQKAIEMGDKDAVNNYEKFCKKVTR
jgi:O-antigen ligase/tetratricopeptide (TPR) repeat protein